MNNYYNESSYKASYLYPMISITLVLFILGLFALFVLHTQSLSSYFKEKVAITLVLAEEAKTQQVEQFQGQMELRPYVKSTEYVSKEEAAKQFTQQYQEDFTEVLDYNPLFSSLTLYLQADYAQKDSLTWIKTDLMQQTLVKEVFYQDMLLDLINTNVKKASLFLLIIIGMFGLIAFTLIDNTIRLTMYSNRFLIKNMQLVGATRKFILRPFTNKSIYNGFNSGLIASVLLVILLTVAYQQLPELAVLYRPFELILVCLSLVGLGILISWWSTKAAVLKYLKLPLEGLY